MEEAKKICDMLAKIKEPAADWYKVKQLVKSLKLCPTWLPVEVWCGWKLYPVKDCLVCTNTGKGGRAYVVLLDDKVDVADKTFIEAKDEDGNIE